MNKLSPDQIECLVWPRDKQIMSELNIEEFQQWYQVQDWRYIIQIGQTKEFKRFVFWHYTLPVRCLRAYYKFKRIFSVQS